jgi:hypothetical protein
MAWPVGDATLPRLYLPAIAQLLGLIGGAAIIAFSFVLARRYDGEAAYTRTG